MNKISSFLLFFCGFVSCSHNVNDTNATSPKFIYIDEIDPHYTSYTDDMTPQQIITYFNSLKNREDMDDRYITEDAVAKIIRTAEQGGSKNQQAWKALENLSAYFDGEYGSLYEYMCLELASSAIPKKKWLTFLEKSCGGPLSYEDVKQTVIQSYSNSMNTALKQINTISKRSDLSNLEKKKQLEYAQKRHQKALEVYEKCLRVFD